MADNTTLNVGVAGDIVRMEERSGVKTQIIGVDHSGADSVELILGLPVTVRATYTSTQTDAAIVTATSGQRIVLLALEVAVSNELIESTAPLVRIGFATATTPTTTGVVFSHPGVASAHYYVKGGSHAPIGIGADEEDLRITTGTFTTGAIDVVATYFIRT